MKGIVHPLSDELGGLVEDDMQNRRDAEPDTSWRWMIGIAVAVGLLAWFTR